MLRWRAKLKKSVEVLLSGQTWSDETEDDCSPLLAEKCFKGTWSEIYSGLDENYICGAVYDDILCSQDIIDDGCREDQGRDNFDSWISGLMAVYNFFCIDHRHQLLHDILQNIEPHGKCFNLTSFVSCVERKTRVTHLTDMLYVTMDAVECNWIMISFATCGSRISLPECEHVQEIISEALQIFFQEAGCAHICSGSNTSYSSTNMLFLCLILFMIKQIDHYMPFFLIPIKLSLNIEKMSK